MTTPQQILGSITADDDLVAELAQEPNDDRLAWDEWAGDEYDWEV